VTSLQTDRLRMRRWRPEDHAPFAEMNADPRVMEHFPAALDRAASDALVDRIERSFDARGYGLWALERRADATFLGFTGLLDVGFEAPFAPALEVGWRLDASAWGQGYASEAARASVAHAFAVVGVDEVVSFTAKRNTRSIAVMERIGMHRDPADDFDHPRLPENHPLRPHVLYRLRAAEWRQRRGA
jgi:ribosomal-protein-alanine N-acetyltransferase